MPLIVLLSKKIELDKWHKSKIKTIIDDDNIKLRLIKSQVPQEVPK